jgi:hypothetical protein
MKKLIFVDNDNETLAKKDSDNVKTNLETFFNLPEDIIETMSIVHDFRHLSKDEMYEMLFDKNNVICTILRLPLIVGENPPGNLGNMIKSIKKRHFFLIKNNNSQKSMVLAKDVANYIPIISNTKEKSVCNSTSSVLWSKKYSPFYLFCLSTRVITTSIISIQISLFYL